MVLPIQPENQDRVQRQSRHWQWNLHLLFHRQSLTLWAAQQAYQSQRHESLPTRRRFGFRYVKRYLGRKIINFCNALCTRLRHCSNRLTTTSIVNLIDFYRVWRQPEFHLQLAEVNKAQPYDNQQSSRNTQHKNRWWKWCRALSLLNPPY